jgi:hypothetical protein
MKNIFNKIMQTTVGKTIQAHPEGGNKNTHFFQEL